MKEFIVDLIHNRCKALIEKYGDLSDATITAIVLYEFKPEDEKGLYWKVKGILGELAADQKTVNVKGNYYPTANLEKIQFKTEKRSLRVNPSHY